MIFVILSIQFCKGKRITFLSQAKYNYFSDGTQMVVMKSSHEKLN